MTTINRPRQHIQGTQSSPMMLVRESWSQILNEFGQSFLMRRLGLQNAVGDHHLGVFRNVPKKGPRIRLQLFGCLGVVVEATRQPMLKHFVQRALWLCFTHPINNEWIISSHLFLFRCLLQVNGITVARCLMVSAAKKKMQEARNNKQQERRTTMERATSDATIFGGRLVQRHIASGLVSIRKTDTGQSHDDEQTFCKFGEGHIYKCFVHYVSSEYYLTTKTRRRHVPKIST